MNINDSMQEGENRGEVILNISMPSSRKRMKLRFLRRIYSRDCSTSTSRDKTFIMNEEMAAAGATNVGSSLFTL